MTVYRIGFMPLSERFYLETQKRCEAYWIGASSWKHDANPDMKMKTLSWKWGLRIEIYHEKKRLISTFKLSLARSLTDLQYSNNRV